MTFRVEFRLGLQMKLCPRVVQFFLEFHISTCSDRGNSNLSSKCLDIYNNNNNIINVRPLSSRIHKINEPRLNRFQAAKMTSSEQR